MNSTLRYVWLTAVRDRLFTVIAALCVAIFMATWIVGGAAIVEGEYASLALAAGSLRAVLMLGLMVFVCFHVQALFDSKEIEAILARPLHRSGFVLTYWLAGALPAAALVALVCVGMLILYPPSLAGWAVWSASLLLEALLVVALSLTIALAMNSAVASAVCTMAVYALGREIGFLLAVTSGQFGVGTQAGAAGHSVETMMQTLALVVPRLDLFGQSEWLLYGPSAGLGSYWFAAQAAVYTALVLAVACVDLRQRRF